MRIQLVSWLFLVLCYWMQSAVSGQSCLEHQQSLLLQLKSNLKFDNVSSSKLVSWNQNSDCCGWIGVSCNQEGQVTRLDLSNESITESLDNLSSLFSLQYLENLNLAFNRFNSVFPSGFNQLKDLDTLNLSNAGFMGPIPMEISQLTRLVTLDISSLYYLSQNDLNLEIPNLQMLLQNLTSVSKLYLDGVSISAQGQEWCQALLPLQDLQELSVSGCNLSGPIDSSLRKLNHLTAIRLDHNNLSTPVPEFFAGFSNITTLHLSSCGLSGRFPAEILQVQALSTLDISYNNDLHGSLPDFIKNGSLQTLVLSNTSFFGALPDSVSNLRQLSRLELSNCQFNGTLPDSMSKLTELTYLDFSFNNFTGPIPSFGFAKKLTHVDLSHNVLTGELQSAHLEDLPNLVDIDLQNNLLNGTIPSSLFALPLLKTIQLSNNHFDAPLDIIPNVSSSVLESLELDGNSLEGPIPSSIFQLKSLKTLQMSSNNFNGTMQLEMIWKFKNLTTLDLSYNNLSVDANVVDANQSSFPNITSLNLASCKLTEFPDFLRNQSRLSNLDLSDNHIQGTIPNWIWELPSLTQLNLSHNSLIKLEGPFQNLTNFTSFRVLDLHSNELQGSLPPIPKNAAYLDYSSNNFSSVIPNDIGDYLLGTIFLSLSNNSFIGSITHSFCNASSLQVLDLSRNNFSDVIPPCLMTMSETLAVLNLGKNQLVGHIPDTFPPSCALQTLDLHHNSLDGPMPKSLANCKALEVLDLGKNEIIDGFPCMLKNTSTLRVLVLHRNQFLGPIGCPNTNGTWAMLQIVDLAYNNFTRKLPGKCFTTWEGMMPEEDQAESQLNHIRFQVLKYDQVYYQDSVTVTIKGLRMKLTKILTVFTCIDFSSNHFEGPIPEELMNLKALYVLNLSNNALSGQIPSSIGNLKQLESLDLSNNFLTEEIPVQLSSLNFLSFLNLSSNHLEGPIPVGPQLQTFEESSFIGNLGLCGPPLHSKCNDADSSSPTEVQYADSKFDWQFVSTGMGFGIGAGLVVAPLMFWERGRKWNKNITDKILEAILPVFGLVYLPIEDEDKGGEDTEELKSDMEEDYDYDKDESNMNYPMFRGRYCVYCSKFDISMKKVIHDPSCTCHLSPPGSISDPSAASYSSQSLVR